MVSSGGSGKRGRPRELLAGSSSFMTPLRDLGVCVTPSERYHWQNAAVPVRQQRIRCNAAMVCAGGGADPFSAPKRTLLIRHAGRCAWRTRNFRPLDTVNNIAAQASYRPTARRRGNRGLLNRPLRTRPWIL